MEILRSENANCMLENGNSALKIEILHSENANLAIKNYSKIDWPECYAQKMQIPC